MDTTNVHILIVEDDGRLRETVARVFQRAGYNITQAADGETAIALLTDEKQASRPCYDLVLTDIVMGNASGVKVASVARSLENAPEVILLTGHGSLETAVEAMRAGAFDYLLKPVRLASLLERVEAALKQRNERLRQQGQAAAWQQVAQVFSTVEQQTVPANPPTPPLAAAEQPGTDPNDTLDRFERSERFEREQGSGSDRFTQVGQLRIDTRRQEVWFAEKQVHVTPIEYNLLMALAEVPGRFVTYGDIVRRTHGSVLDEREAYNLLRTHVRNLRRKFDRRYLVSVRGVGYMLDDLNQQADSDEGD